MVDGVKQTCFFPFEPYWAVDLGFQVVVEKVKLVASGIIFQCPNIYLHINMKHVPPIYTFR